MTADKYRDLVTIQQDNSTPSDIGPDYSGEAFAEDIPCRVINVSGEETFRGRQLEARVKYVVEFWRVENIKADMRAKVTEGVYSGELLNIAYVKQMQFDKGRPAKTLLYCATLEG